MNFPKLFSPLQIGPYQLKHRLALAPLTRMRAAKPSLAPRPLNAEYYAQRATPGGLLIAEASPVAATAFGSPGVPGIYTEAQIAGWRKVVDAVHAKGGIIFLQLWHVGRVSHSSFQPGGALPVAPSAVAIPEEFKACTADGKIVPYETPRALETAEIPAWSMPSGRPRKTRWPPASTASRSTAPTAICSNNSCSRAATSAPTAMAARSRTARGCCWRSRRPRSRSGARAASACGCRPTASPMAPASRTRCRSTPMSCRRSIRSGLPICTSSSRVRAAPAAPRSTGRTCRRRWCCSARSGKAS